VQIRVLGSGASDGWPNPWCSCHSCAAAREQGVRRGQSSVLLDDRVLVDLGPTAAVHGGDLNGVSVVLVTHEHVDHHFGQAWVWRSWARGTRPLTVLAPPGVLRDARLGQDVTALTVQPGERHEVDGYAVRVLEAKHTPQSVLYDITGPDGGTLLYASDTGVLPASTVEAVRDRAFDVVLLELAGLPLPTHLTLETWPAQVERLRAVGAVTDATQLLATHLGHDNPPPDELDRLLADLGARACRDGDLLETSGRR